MTTRPLVGLLGGTFDPIHLGHVAAAFAAWHALGLDRVRLIVSARPPHRPDSPRVSEYHRLQMMRLAIDDAMAAGGLRLEVSDLEVRRDGPSYTYDTLQTLQAQGLTPLQMVFITGADAFAEIGTWHRYPEVLDQAHFAVIARPGTNLASLDTRLPALASRMIGPPQFNDAVTPRIVLIEHDTPDVSSTEIRRRALVGASLDGLVSPSVAEYIAHHHLYRSDPTR